MSEKMKITFNPESLKLATSLVEKKKEEQNKVAVVKKKMFKKPFKQQKKVNKPRKKFAFVVDNEKGYQSGYSFKKEKKIVLCQTQMDYMKVLNAVHIRDRIKNHPEANKKWQEIRNKMKEKKAIADVAFNKRGVVLNKEKEKEYITIRNEIIDMKKNFIDYLLKNLSNKQ